MKQHINITYTVYAEISELSQSDQSLIKEAIEASGNAYAPYSNFRVGAALRFRDGKVIRANNQENIAYPSGLCAERVALFYAGANFPGEIIDTLCIVANGSLIDKEKPLSPCGSCRQVMVESENRQGANYRILILNQNGSVMEFESAKSLLPLSFGS